MQKIEVEIFNTSKQSAAQAIIQFTRTRTEIGIIEAENTAVQPGGQLRYVLHFSPELAPEQIVVFHVIYEGEPVSVEWIKFDTSEKIDIFSRFKSISSFAMEEKQAPMITEFRERMDFIHKIEDPVIKKGQLFFARYDHDTYPALVEMDTSLSAEEKQKRLSTVGRAVGILSTRVLRRGFYALQNRTPSPGELSSLDKDSTIYLSKLQRDIYESFYHGEKGLDLEGIVDAFFRFANGEFRFEDVLKIRNGEPDSAFEFSFAEFPLMAIEHAVDVDFWTPIVPFIIASQEIFMQVYRPNMTGPYHYQQYRPENFHSSKIVNDDFKQQLKSRYNKMPLENAITQMGQNALEAFRADYQKTK